MLPHSHDVGSQAPKPSTKIPPPLAVTTMFLTLLVAGLVLAHVPNRTELGAGGTGLASAGADDDSSVAATAVDVISAAMTARRANFTRGSPPLRAALPAAAAIDTEEVTLLQIHQPRA